MLGTVLAKLAMGMVVKLMTEAFFATLLVEGMRAWSKQTENKHDDRVAAAVAKAFGVPPENLTETKK